MAITLVGTAKDTNVNGGNVTITLPAGIAENDIVLVMGGTGNNGSPAAVTTSGYTSIETASRSNVDFCAAWKRMSSSPDSSVTCNGGGAGNDSVAYVAMVFRGVDTSTAIDATTVTDSNDNSQPNSPAIVTVTDGAAVVSCYVIELDDDTSFAPTGFGGKITAARGDTNPVGVGAAWFAQSPAGSINPTAWSGLSPISSGVDWIASTIALRPAVAGVVTDSVLAATGTGSVEFVGFQEADGRLETLLLSSISFAGSAILGSPASLTGTGTAEFVGNSLGTIGAFSMNGTGAASWVGALAGGGPFSMRGTGTLEFSGGSINSVLFNHTGAWSATFVGGTSNMTSVREVVESRGAATVRVGR